jgi:hypothetical protein
MREKLQQTLRLFLTACLAVSTYTPLPAEEIITPPDDDPIIIIEEGATLAGIYVVAPASQTFEVGQTHDFNAIGTYSDGTTQTVNPSWTASCGEINAATGEYSATEAGSCTITATLNTFTHSLSLSVFHPAPTLQNINITEPADLNFEVGESFHFNATGSYSDGSTAEVNPSWSASCGEIDPATGQYSATTAGTCVVTASLDGKTDTVALTVTVPPPALTQIAIVHSPNPHIQLGEAFDFDAEGSYSDGSKKEVHPVWSASCGAIDSATGQYSATQPGTCTITASLDGHSDTASVIVKIPPPNIVLERARVIFNFEKHGPFHPELKKFLDWAGIAFDDKALMDAVRDFGRPCKKDSQASNNGDKSEKEDKGKGKDKKNKVEDEGERETADEAIHVLNLLSLVDASWAGGIEEFKLILTCHTGKRDALELRMVYHQPVLRTWDGAKVQIPAEVDFDPDTLNVDSKREFVTMRLSLPAGYDVRAVSRLTVGITKIDGNLISEPPLRSSPQAFAIDDPDGDGTAELMLKFRFSRLKPHLPAGDSSHFTVTGLLYTGEEFSSDYTQILVRRNGHKEVSDKKGRAKVKVDDDDHAGDIDVTVEEVDEQDPDRGRKAEEAGIKAAGRGYKFGPAGTQFQKPVDITLPYDPAGLTPEQEDALSVHYWNASAKAWEKLGSRVDKEAQKVSASVNHFSYYQVLAPVAPAAVETVSDPGFALGQVYAFPNPSRGVPPTLHMEVGKADEVRIHIYDVSGHLRHEASVGGAPSLVDGVHAYEYVWHAADEAPGLYIFTVRAKRAGYGDLTATGKVAIVK